MVTVLTGQGWLASETQAGLRGGRVPGVASPRLRLPRTELGPGAAWGKGERGLLQLEMHAVTPGPGPEPTFPPCSPRVLSLSPFLCLIQGQT